MTVYMPDTDYKAICDATREKCGTTGLLKSGEIKPLLAALETKEKPFLLTVNVESGSTVVATKGMAGDVLEYIESSGTQYIDTGFQPNQDTRVVMDVDILSVPASSAAILGARESAQKNSFVMFTLSGTQLRSDYYGDTLNQVKMTLNSILGRYQIDKNKNVCTANGVEAVNTAANFDVPYNLYLFATNTAGAVFATKPEMRCYSCQIYNNGALVRDFVPFRTAAGEVGLLDRCNNVFYPNAGTGVFTTGATIETIAPLQVSGTAANGKCVLELPEAGVWAVAATLGSSSASGVVQVVGDYAVDVGAFIVDPVFANNDWATIIKACQRRLVPDSWKVADQKPMTINGTDYLIDIIGKNHDPYSDGSGYAPLTFQMHDCYNATYGMNSSDTNVGGWGDSEMRKTHLPAILALMPAEFRAGIKEVNKLTSDGNNSSSINITADKLFLLSQTECDNNTSYTYAGEGKQYSYYAAGNSKVKNVNFSASAWWYRSPAKGGTNMFACAASNGSATSYVATTNRGVAFAFCF